MTVDRSPDTPRRPRVLVRLHDQGAASLVVGSALTIMFLLVSILSLFAMPHDPNAISVPQRLLPAGSPNHLLGTDALGRDVLSAIMDGAHTSLLVGAVGALVALVIGCLAGIVAATRSPRVDEIIMRSADIILAVPGIIFALVLAATLGGGMTPTIIALALFFMPSFARVVRASTMKVMAEEFVTAARLYGRRQTFIIFRHVVPNIVSVLIVQFTLYFAAGILIEAGLSYLGIGVQRPGISWGLLLKEAQAQVGVSGTLALWPGLAIGFAVLGLNLFGDGLRDILDPKLERRRL